MRDTISNKQCQQLGDDFKGGWDCFGKKETSLVCIFKTASDVRRRKKGRITLGRVHKYLAEKWAFLGHILNLSKTILSNTHQILSQGMWLC